MVSSAHRDGGPPAWRGDRRHLVGSSARADSLGDPQIESVSRRFQRRLGVLLVSAGAAFGVWKFAPGTAVERLAFKAVSGALGDPQMLVSGQGTSAVPWALRNTSVATTSGKDGISVSLGDDAGGVFQSSPPAPIDYSVIFAN